MSTNKRADRVWKRLIEAYGSRVAENYGRDIPQSWVTAIADLTDEQIAYGLRKVMRDTPIHPPSQGQFVACCVDLPQAIQSSGPNIQEQLCAYASLQLRPRLDPLQYALPWTYLYREWIDEEKPKHLQRQAECIGVVIPACATHDSFRFMVTDMLGDKVGHAAALKTFEPGPPPSAEQIKRYREMKAKLAERNKPA